MLPFPLSFINLEQTENLKLHIHVYKFKFCFSGIIQNYNQILVFLQVSLCVYALACFGKLIHQKQDCKYLLILNLV